MRYDESGKALVYVVGDDDLVNLVNVTTGTHTGQSIEIVSGVAAGQKVVDAHLKRFATAQKVRVLENLFEVLGRDKRFRRLQRTAEDIDSGPRVLGPHDIELAGERINTHLRQ